MLLHGNFSTVLGQIFELKEEILCEKFSLKILLYKNTGMNQIYLLARSTQQVDILEPLLDHLILITLCSDGYIETQRVKLSFPKLDVAKQEM